MEWETWLRQQADIKIYALVETHWSFSNVYISGDWHITHSAEPGAKRCGVMVGVRKDCVELDSIKWRELIPGRLLHWRGAIGKQQFDIAAVCQTALGFVSGGKQVVLMKERKKLWNSLDSLLSGSEHHALSLSGGGRARNSCWLQGPLDGSGA